MKFEVTRTITEIIEFDYLDISLPADVLVNPPADLPMLEGDRWQIRIDLETGQIWGWPGGTVATVQYEDNGGQVSGATATLVNERYSVTARDVVPTYQGTFLIDGDGYIDGWSADEISFDDFFPLD